MSNWTSATRCRSTTRSAHCRLTENQYQVISVMLMSLGHDNEVSARPDRPDAALQPGRSRSVHRRARRSSGSVLAHQGGRPSGRVPVGAGPGLRDADLDGTRYLTVDGAPVTPTD